MRIRGYSATAFASSMVALLIATLLFPSILDSQIAGTARKAKQAEAAKSRSTELITRGKYIVEGVAACSDCHTPRGENGEADRSRWLAGAPLFFRPAQPVPGWPVTAPRLAGIPPGGDAEIVRLLTSGVWRDGKPLRLPMPRFRMTRDDAEAVLAYLKSL